MSSPVSYVVAGAAALAIGLGPLVPPALDGDDTASPTRPESAREAATTRHVVAVSVDGLNPRAIRELGRRRAPVLHRLRAQGTGTLNARTERELTVTLPNHTGMVTGRRVAADGGGHSVT